jgi:hypothetical protein
MQRFKLRLILISLLLICLALSQPHSVKATNQCEYFLLSGTVPADTTKYSNFVGTWGNSTSANIIKFAPGTRIHAKVTHNHPANTHLTVWVGSYSSSGSDWDTIDGPSPSELYLIAPSYPNPDPFSGGNWFLMQYEVIGWKYLGRDGTWHDDGTVAYTLSIFGDCL